ncbi:MAG TPA: TolC family protein [Gemmataceae bacterium]|nr:TolC family protein [Gemmataceae bacterium]
MTRARTWKWTVPGLALLAGCAALDEGPMPSLPDPPTLARYRPSLPPAMPPMAVSVGKPSDDEKPAAPEKRPVEKALPEKPAAVELVLVKADTAAPKSTAQTPAKADAPAPKSVPDSLPMGTDATPAVTAVPVSLDAVMRLAEDQNAQVALAREKINQAYAEQELADKRILPDVTVGTGYWRHEGGIQLQEGPLIRSSTGAMLSGADIYARLDLKAITFAKLDAARKTLQARGEAKRVTTEVLLEASSAYIDLLAAHSGLAISRDLDGELRKLLNRAERAANVERGWQVEVVRIRAEVNGQAQSIRHLETQAKAAAAKLAYLLGMDPCSAELTPTDEQLVAFRLVDANQPAEALCSQAMANGSGLRELEGILAVIQEGMSKGESPTRFLPVFEARAIEGLFGAGANDNMVFANRLDVGVQARWNLTELCTASTQRRIGCSLLAQTQLTYTDARSKLALGVRQAREASVSGEQELTLTTEQILQAKRAAELSDMRLNEGLTNSFTEVLLAKKSVAGAQANYLSVLRDFDKAQLRLMVLCGMKSGDGACNTAGVR